MNIIVDVDEGGSIDVCEGVVDNVTGVDMLIVAQHSQCQI